MRRLFCCSLFAVALALAGTGGSHPRLALAEDKKPDDGFKPLFDGKTLTGWVNVNCHPDTFFVKDGEIVTTGQPTGFLRSDRQYENFVLEFDWMHVEKVKMANSGLFVWGDPLPAVGTPYTRGIEVQVLINFAPKDGWATSHGDIFSIHGARCVPDRVHPVNPKMERCLPSENRVKGGGEWNHYKVTANDGVIKLEVNGKEVSGVSKCNPRKGYLALESEGSECHFKNIKIKELPSTNPKPEEVAKADQGHVSIFNGLDLKGWEVAKKDAWKAGGGVLRCGGDAQLVSEKKYTRCELVIDWKLPAKADKPFAAWAGPVFFEVAANGHGKIAWSNEKGTKIGAGDYEGIKPTGWNRIVVGYDGNNATFSINGQEPVKGKVDGALSATTINIFPVKGMEVMNVFVRELKEEKK